MYMDYSEEQYNSICRAYEMTCRNANPTGWNQMTVSERVGALQAVENYLAMQQGRAPAIVSAHDTGELLAEQELGHIYINASLLERAVQSAEEIIDFINSIGHEGSHERDAQAMIDPEVAKQYPEGEVKARNDNYVTYAEDPTANYNHPSEVAARAMGDHVASRFVHDQALVAEADRAYYAEIGIKNQILHTGDYNAIDYAGEHGILPPSAEDEEEAAEQQKQEEIDNEINIEESQDKLEDTEEVDNETGSEESQDALEDAEEIDSETGSEESQDALEDTEEVDSETSTEESQDAFEDAEEIDDEADAEESSNDAESGVNDDFGMYDDYGIE